MKIAFVTSGLEPGRNGVGDYTTLLAAECERRGHKTIRMALNDRLANDIDHEPEMLRLSAALPWANRVDEVRKGLADFAPDIVSLQFVCYGFDPRGLIGPQLREALRGWPVQVFMHELWLGDEVGASAKHRIVGWLQRRGVLSLLRSLDVRLIHTSNAAYVHRLARHHRKARELPLFGSLPAPSPGITPPEDRLVFVLFGTLHPIWPAEPLFGLLRQVGRPVTIAHVGGIGAGANLWERLQRDHGTTFEFRRSGELPPQDIADIFAAAHFGIATTPWALIGKSASAAAMLDAGLPVIVNRDDVHYRGFTPTQPDDRFLLVNDTLPARLHEAKRREPRLRLTEVADQFLTELEEAQR